MSDANTRTPEILDEATKVLRDAPTPAGPPDELVVATVAAMKSRLASPSPASELAYPQRRRLMHYLGYGTATIFAATFAAVGVFWFAGPSASAEVRKAMNEAAKAKSVRVVQKVGDTVQYTNYYQGNVFRMEVPDKSVEIIDLKARKGIELDLVAKTARPFNLTEEYERTAALDFAAAKDFLSVVRGMKDAEIKETKNEKVGDRATKVYAISYPGDGEIAPMKATLWVDEKTGFPVRLQHHDHPQGDSILEFDSWNEEFPAKLFDMKVPAGYREVKE